MALFFYQFTPLYGHNLFSGESFSLQSEYFKIKRENCYFMPFVSSVDSILKKDISYVIKKSQINSNYEKSET